MTRKVHVIEDRVVSDPRHSAMVKIRGERNGNTIHAPNGIRWIIGKVSG